jgi:hypothetical protein
LPFIGLVLFPTLQTVSPHGSIFGSHVKAPPGNDEWSELAHWLAQPPDKRTLTPDLRFTCRQIAEREREVGTKEGLESALRYDTTLPLARIMLAGVLQREDTEKKQDERDPSVPARVKFLREYDVKHLPPDPAICQRAAELLRKQGQEELAQQALARARGTGK